MPLLLQLLACNCQCGDVLAMPAVSLPSCLTGRMFSEDGKTAQAV